jgi:nitric oxide reductase NorD protein
MTASDPLIFGQALNAEQIELRLDQHLEAALSSRRTAAAPARSLAQVSAVQQALALRWVAVVATTNAELAYQLAAHATEAFRHLDDHGVEAWVLQAMDAYDTRGLMYALGVLQNVERFAGERCARATGLAFEEVEAVLRCATSCAD